MHIGNTNNLSVTVIDVKNVSKAYRIWRDSSARLQAPIFDVICKFCPSWVLNSKKLTYLKKSGYTDFYALDRVSLNIKKGESVGIIGRNGSGKSTLLQLIAGTLVPTAGSIKVDGRVAALLELGSGFNPDFTGRENVYLNASVLGLTRREIDARYDRIMSFADIGSFAEQPVKTYSSGMAMRLAFAVIAHVDADIFIIDEAFAVGDVFFQQKCMRFLRNFKEQKGTLLFVSHDMGAINSLCERAVLIKRGKDGQTLIEGNPEQIGKIYLGEIYSERSEGKVDAQSVTHTPDSPVPEPKGLRSFSGDEMEVMHVFISPFQKHADSFGSKGGTIETAYFTDQHGTIIENTFAGQQVSLVIDAVCHKDMLFPAFGFMIKDRTGQYLIAEGSDRPFRNAALTTRRSDKMRVIFSFAMPVLIKGDYSINVAFAEGPGDDHIQHHWIHDALILKVAGDRLVHGIVGLNNLHVKIDVESQFNR